MKRGKCELADQSRPPSFGLFPNQTLEVFSRGILLRPPWKFQGEGAGPLFLSLGCLCIMLNGFLTGWVEIYDIFLIKRPSMKREIHLILLFFIIFSLTTSSWGLAGEEYEEKFEAQGRKLTVDRGLFDSIEQRQTC